MDMCYRWKSRNHCYMLSRKAIIMAGKTVKVWIVSLLGILKLSWTWYELPSCNICTLMLQCICHALIKHDLDVPTIPLSFFVFQEQLDWTTFQTEAALTKGLGFVIPYHQDLRFKSFLVIEQANFYTTYICFIYCGKQLWERSVEILELGGFVMQNFSQNKNGT